MRIEERVPLPVAPIDLVRHELMSPVTIMGGVVELLDRRMADLDDSQRDALLAALRRQLTLLAAIIGRLGSLSDLEHQHVQLDLQPVDVGTVVRALVDDLGGAGSSGATIRVRAADRALASADVTALQEILLNLLGNAVRYSAGAPIDVDVDARNGAVEVRVRDRGPGVPPADRDRIFDPYVRGADQSPGLGIGLALGRGLAEAQGGALRLGQPPSGDGSVFVLSLPHATRG